MSSTKQDNIDDPPYSQATQGEDFADSSSGVTQNKSVDTETPEK